MPMTFDTYSNCAFQCLYCFSYFQRAIGGSTDDYLHHKVRSVDVERVKKIFRLEIPKNIFAFYIKSRMVLQWGGLSDGFDYYERKFRKSLELMRFFREIDYPVSISTKGTWFIEDSEYREVFSNAGNVHLKTSIITLDEDKAHAIERGVSSSRERLKMLEEAKKLGVAATTVRFRPFVLGASADYPFTENSKRQINEYMKMCADHGVYSVTTEFMCWESRASKITRERLAELSKITGIPDILAFYRANSTTGVGLMRLNYDLKRPYMEAMQESAEKYGLRFFVSDAHHKERSYHAGCCGLPDTGPLSVTNKGQYAEAILIAKREGRVSWSDIAKDAEWLKDVPLNEFRHDSTEARIKNDYKTTVDYMHECWNNTKSFMSPARYFGGALVPSTLDEAGDIVYLYNEPFVARGERVASAQELQSQLVAKGFAMQEDGQLFGHVAYPIRVDASGIDPIGKSASLLRSLEKSRLQYRLCVTAGRAEEFSEYYPQADVVELVNSNARDEILMASALDGNEHIWIFDAAIIEKVDRALLSDLEQKYSDHGFAQFPPGASIEICAVKEPMI